MADAELLERDVREVERLAALVAGRLAEGRRVLVRCQAGLNRSSLVAARALVLSGWAPADAVAAIRAARSPNCLFNREFLQYVLRRDPVEG